MRREGRKARSRPAREGPALAAVDDHREAERDALGVAEVAVEGRRAGRARRSDALFEVDRGDGPPLDRIGERGAAGAGDGAVPEVPHEVARGVDPDVVISGLVLSVREGVGQVEIAEPLVGRAHLEVQRQLVRLSVRVVRIASPGEPLRADRDRNRLGLFPAAAQAGGLLEERLGPAAGAGVVGRGPRLGTGREDPALGAHALDEPRDALGGGNEGPVTGQEEVAVLDAHAGGVSEPAGEVNGLRRRGASPAPPPGGAWCPSSGSPRRAWHGARPAPRARPARSARRRTPGGDHRPHPGARGS